MSATANDGAHGRWWQRSISVRIIVLFLGLLLGVQLTGFVALRGSLLEHAHRVLPTRLQEGERLVQTLLDRQGQTLIGGARLLAADYGFRETLSSDDDATIVSVLANHGARIGATEVALLAPDFRLRSSTAPHAPELALLAARLATRAASAGQASTVALLGGQPHQAVLVPVKAPLLVGWVLMAFPLDGQLATDLRSLSGLDLTVLTRASPADDGWSVQLSSLDAPHAQSLARLSWDDAARDAPMVSVKAQGEELGVRVKALVTSDAAGPGGGIVALVSLSVDEAVRLPRDLQRALIGITALAVVVFAIGSVLTARRVTTPLRGLADAAERLGAGDYATPMCEAQRHDEIGELSHSFERMRVRIGENQAQITRLAYWDSLTELPNRARFRDVVNEAICETGRASGVSVVMLDLNRFKHVNDVLGYRAGDQLLVKVAERLSDLVREGDVVARLGGDEFGILLRGGSAQLALSVAQRIEHEFDTPLVVDEHHVDMGAGIGIACWPQHAEDADALLNRAEVAMYTAKRRGNGPLVYEQSIDVASAQMLTLMSELRHAVDHGELRLYLQPKVGLGDGALVGAEALLRWQHPQRGLVPPLQFIPFAEQTGFIRVLTLWVFEEAARLWKALNARGIVVTLAINLSTRDLMDIELPQIFEALLARHGVAAGALRLEITESAIMDDAQRAVLTLDRLSAMGFGLSIDDFGTGYSSLAYLKRLPVDELKIDQSFIRNMPRERDDAMIVRSTIELAHNLGLTVVAEGVEDAHAWDQLRALDCDQVQGYHMGKPMPVGEFCEWAGRWSARGASAAALVAHLLH